LGSVLDLLMFLSPYDIDTLRPGGHHLRMVQL
jgi:hypothetical protein